eukprot:NODE_5073_length_1072_cov_32.637513_g4517_i0.p1 GENE.NODE_5073_length_1072_cov_32.637513_g4517_i0~~NODE_5073_length_1072_cov_32.637513_g4517_i0.p1  ORF type:complete len:323 (-),score=86.49 NODE_5073_length_1072_cov_32.637513_g4517_i0:102-1031(-)
MCGSDDWRVYLWRISDAVEREQVQPDLHVNVSTDSHRIVESPSHILEGHQSVVNSVIWNPSYHLIATSGVERTIRLWDLFPEGPQDQAPYVRREAYTISVFLSSGNRPSEEEDLTLALFDFYVERTRSDVSECDCDDLESDEEEDEDREESGSMRMAHDSTQDLCCILDSLIPKDNVDNNDREASLTHVNSDMEGAQSQETLSSCNESETQINNTTTNNDLTSQLEETMISTPDATTNTTTTTTTTTTTIDQPVDSAPKLTFKIGRTAKSAAKTEPRKLSTVTQATNLEGESEDEDTNDNEPPPTKKKK